MINVLIAPDKFKGSLSALAVGKSIYRGIMRASQEVNCHIHPLADGGDGSLQVLSAHMEMEPVCIEVMNAIGKPKEALYYRSDKTAYVELAAASGLAELSLAELNPMGAHTRGAGVMIRHAIDHGARHIYLFLGGSASTDGGMGIAHELGYRFFDNKGMELSPCGSSLGNIAEVHLTDIRYRNALLSLTLLCDVTNPLYGLNGAAFTYAPQKGADQSMVRQLDQGLIHYSENIKKSYQMDVAFIPGAGAAGGVGASLIPMFNAQIRSGIDVIMENTGFEAKLKDAHIVISGEGKVDEQSVNGKVISGISRLCKNYNKPLYIFCGQSTLTKDQWTKYGISDIYSLMGRTGQLDQAILEAPRLLEELAEQFWKEYNKGL